MTTAPMPPANLEAEESVLGAMMINRNAIVACTDVLTAEDFYRGSHGCVYQAILELDLRDEPVDFITLSDFLEERGELDKAGGKPRLAELASIVPATANAGHYAQIIREMAQLRGLIRVGHELARMGFERPGEIEELIDRSETLVLDLAQTRDRGELEHVSASLAHTNRLMAELAHADITGTSTGLRALDELTAGLQPGNLVVVAARPSMGKSALALGISRHVAMLNTPVAIFSLEMSKTEVDQRLICHETNIPLQKLRKPKTLLQPEWSSVLGATNTLARLPLYIDDSGDIRITELRSRARRLKSRQPSLGLIVVDYLQLMVAEGRIENRVQEVSQISRGLKVLARDLHIPVIAVSQLNRSLENRSNKRPQLSDLRDSGAVEQDADVVIFVYREEVYSGNNPGEAELIVAKHRNGPTDTLKATWMKRTARFADA